ncbi:MAG: hypothetical protein NTY19_24860 [Planctomycetota bacterium]|nr:hypothetical protein [Planctomycetota bacterium]
MNSALRRDKPSGEWYTWVLVKHWRMLNVGNRRWPLVTMHQGLG